MRLTAYRLGPVVPVLRPATPRRAWMDETTERYAYRCLPLTMGNMFGWELLSPATFEALWTGGRGVGAIQVVRLDGGKGQLPSSHFGHGVLTFNTSHLFRTDARCQMFVTGPPNLPKDGIAPLTGMVETDWLPFAFTMNWRFTRPGVPVRFEEGEPFCHFFPVSAGALEAIEPVLRDLDDEPELAAQYREWKASRDQWVEDLQVPGTVANQQGWQRFYHRGLQLDGERAPVEHRTRMRLCPFHAAAGEAGEEVEASRAEAPVEDGAEVAAG
ncbi:MAG TPA: DUF6065 family protein [Longimicrobium sp.]|nr:DUF6065 family protein [Longimicrobium sp.]